MSEQSLEDFEAAHGPLSEDEILDISEAVEAPKDPVNKAEAAWVMRRLRRARQAIAENDATYAQLIAETDEWHDRVNAPLLREAEECERQLGNFLRARVEADPAGPKSIELPGGRVKSRVGGLTVEISDHDALLDWATQHDPELLEWPEAPPPYPNRNAIKERLVTPEDPERPGEFPLVTTDGEVVPGVKLIRKERSFTTEVDL